MTRKPWTNVELALLDANFADSRTDDLACALGRGYSQVAQKAAARGLRKSPAYLAGPEAHRFDGLKGMGTRIQPGSVPWNKGKPGSTGTHPACRATQFQKGRPAREARNYLPIGSLRICASGYLERKTTDDAEIAPARRWVAVHRLVWEAANGAVAPGHLIVFRNGRRTTDIEKVTLDSLELVTRAENMHRNSVHSKYPPEVARLVQLRGALTRQINRKAKEAETP